jgi:hypothetical protein
VTKTDFMNSGKEHEFYQPLGTALLTVFPTFEVGDARSKSRFIFSRFI